VQAALQLPSGFTLIARTNARLALAEVELRKAGRGTVSLTDSGSARPARGLHTHP